MKKYNILLLALLLMIVQQNEVFATFQNVDSGLIDRSNKDLIEKPLFNHVEPLQEKKPAETRRFLNQNANVKNGEYIENPTFTLKEVLFLGNTIYSDRKLSELAGDFLGQDIFFNDIMTIITRINQKYQEDGYLTSYAFIPPQDVVGGVIKIKIAESKISNISVDGNNWTRESYLRNRVMKKYGFVEGKIFNNNPLKNTLKQLNDNDYMKAGIGVSRTDADETVINLNVKDRFPISFDVIWDNFGRRLTGRQRAGLILSDDSFTKNGDRIYGGAILADGTTGALAGYELPVGPYGTKLAFDYSHSNINLGKEYSKDNIRGSANDYIISIKQPIYEAHDTNLEGRFSFDALDSNTQIKSLNTTISDYKLRVFRLGIDYSHDDVRGRWLANFGTDFGARCLRASKSITGGPQSDFFKLRGEVARVQRVKKESYYIVKTNWQYSPHSLYAAEQFQLGGPYSVRGYEPGAIIGDYGFGATFELRTPTHYLKALLPKKFEHWTSKIKLTNFYDCGFTEDHHNLYGYTESFIHSIGTGLHFDLTKNVTAAVNVAVPLGRANYAREDARFNFSINTAVDKIFFKDDKNMLSPYL